MTLGGYIKKLIGPSLKEKGFEFIGKVSAVSWKFVKEDESQKIIHFQKSNIVKNAFKVNLETNQLPKKAPLNLSCFVEGQEYWWEYDESTLENILFKVLEVIIDKGIPYLDEIAIPDLDPPSTMHFTLIENAETLAKQFITENNLSNDQPDYIAVIREKLLERIESNHNPDWDLILKASAAIGEYLIKHYDGEWGWAHTVQGVSVIKNIGGMENEIPPLIWVSRFWGKPYVYGYDFYKKYKSLITSLSN